MKSLTKKHCLRSQVHLGHSSSEWNPNMSSFLLGERDKSHIFDLSQTLFLLKRSLKVIKEVASQDGQILFLGKSPKKIAKITKQNNPYDKILKNAAIQCSQPYITGQDKWVNGTFTNWEEMIKQFSRKIEKQQIKDLKNKSSGGESSPAFGRRAGNYLKSGYKPGLLEQRFSLIEGRTTLMMASEAANLDLKKQNKKSNLLENDGFFEGKQDMTSYFSKARSNSKSRKSSREWPSTGLHKISGNRFSKPDLIFAIGISDLDQALKEANNAGIPIVAVVDSNQNPFIKGRVIDYIIPGNDDSIRSYAFFCMIVSQAIQEGNLLSKTSSHGKATLPTYI